MVMVSVLINSEKKHHHSPYSLENENENENAAFGKSSSLFL